MTTHIIRWESWALTEEANRRFRRIVAAVSVPALLLAIVLTLVHFELPPKPAPVFNPNRFVELLQQEIPKPPPPKPEEKPKPEQKPTEKLPPPPKPVVRPVEKPVPPPPKPVPSARDIARSTKEFQAIQQLAHLQPEDANVSTAPLVSPTISSTGGVAVSGENIASGAARTSGGIGYAGSVAQGEGSVGLGSRRTATVRSGIDVNRPRDSGPAQPVRSIKEIEEVFDRNQGALNGIYTRAERENPGIADGKIVISITIAPGGEVTACSLVYSSFNAPEFESKVIERIKLFRFAAKNVPSFTYPSYTLTFQPS